jgi:hypothetical protein
MTWVCTDTFSFALLCTEQTKDFVDERQANQWLKMHRKRCDKCRNAKAVDVSGYNISRNVNSPADEVRLKRDEIEEMKRIIGTMKA